MIVGPHVRNNGGHAFTNETSDLKSLPAPAVIVWMIWPGIITEARVCQTSTSTPIRVTWPCGKPLARAWTTLCAVSEKTYPKAMT
eukprot:CAMPEP_0173305234 /NCGR_PEP_ID=MMETSP1143-20121109/19889_1 /TAXON_ID=483371 /ORGANISM="non described non described, Strain CCMP2298" /LENGTH=84 /DNA_ID=CAMNT_0014246147 /DNA_START=121 /DNA_END=375 /DNA_ORIENTATION=+